MGDSKLNPPPFLYQRYKVVRYNPNIQPVTEELDKLAMRLAKQYKEVGVFRSCVESHGPYNLDHLPEQAHAAAPLLNYTRYHSIMLDIPRIINNEELVKVIAYGAHTSTNK